MVVPSTEVPFALRRNSDASVLRGTRVGEATKPPLYGTWNVEVMSHQIALVIEPQDGNKVTATMMMMGTDVPLKGELVDDTLTLTGVKPEAGAVGAHVPQGPGAKPITVKLLEDGTVAGEMMTNNGPVKWTGEKLKTKKKS